MERQMAAERERRALLAKSEGTKMSLINNSEGRMQEMINQSEGAKARKVNEAEGRAAEILAVATATADSIKTLGSALTADGGAEAIRLRLSQKYIKNLGNLGQQSTRLLIPADVTRLDELLKNVGLDSAAAEAEAEQLREQAKLLPAKTASAQRVPVGSTQPARAPASPPPAVRAPVPAAAPAAPAVPAAGQVAAPATTPNAQPLVTSKE